MQLFNPIHYNNELDITPTADFKSAVFWHDYVDENHQDPSEIALCVGIIINSGLHLSDRRDACDEDLIKAYNLICLGLGLYDYLGYEMPDQMQDIIRAKLDQNMPEFFI